MNKKVVVASMVMSALTASVFAADNNFIGGTDNVCLLYTSDAADE